MTPLDGPFPDPAGYLRECEPARQPQLTVLGEKRGPRDVMVTLTEVRRGPAAAGCIVTVKTKAGFYTGPQFLCAADRSDEAARTDHVEIDLDEQSAVVRFRVAFQVRGYLPRHDEHVIRCALDGTVPACSAAPSIGGYGPSPCHE